MRRRSWIILGIVAVVAIGGTVAYRARTRTTTSTTPTEVVKRGTLRATVIETGSVESASAVKVTPLVSGQVDRVIVKNGDRVLAGDPLLALATDAPVVKFKQAQASVDRARATLALAVRGSKAEDVAALQQAVDNATISLAKARAVYDATVAQINRDVASTNATVTAAASRAATAAARASDVSATTAADLATLREQRSAQQAKISRLEDQRDIREDIVDARNDAARQALTNATNALTKAQANRAACTAATCTPDQISKLDDAVTQAQVTQTSAQSNVETTARSGELELQQADDGIDSARESLTQLDRQITSSQVKGAASVNDATASASQANVDLASQQASAAAARANADLRRRSAESALASAVAQLETAKAQYAVATRDATNEDLAATKADIASAEAALLDARTTLGNYTLRAPTGGVVSQLTIKAGESAGPSTVVALVTDDADLRVTVNVSEAEVARVAVGQAVELTFDALDASTVVTGEVTEIETTPTIVQGVVFYATRVSIAPGEATQVLRPGMTANVTIVTLEVPDVLLVPSRAIKTVGRAASVSVRQPDGSFVDQRITTGRKGDDATEVTDGLEAGSTIATVRSSTTTPSGGGGFRPPG